MSRSRGPRKMQESRTGRVYWKPGTPHPLDALKEELTELRQQLPGDIAALVQVAQQTEQHLQALQQLEQDDLTAPFTAADHLASHAVNARFSDRKHSYHLQMIFAIQRRTRLLGRLRAIRAALDLANGLLDEEETLTEEFLSTWQEKTAAKETPPEQEDLQRIEGERKRPKEERRIEHLDEPLTPLVGSVEQSRQLLRDFEAKLPELRKDLVAGQGWIEVFYVPKRRYKQEVKDYASALLAQRKHQLPIPEAIERAIDPRVATLIQQGITDFPPALRDLVYDILQVGPYAKYRWREDGQVYSISLGLLEDYPEFPFVPQGF